MMKSKRRPKQYLKTNEMETKFPKPIRCNKNICMWEIYSNKGLPQEIRKTSNKQSNLPLKRTERLPWWFTGKEPSCQ